MADLNQMLESILDRVNAQDERINFLSRLEFAFAKTGGLTDGGVIFADNGGLLSDDASNLVWDNVEKVFIIGGNIQSAGVGKLQVKGATGATGAHATFTSNADNYPLLRYLS